MAFMSSQTPSTVHFECIGSCCMHGHPSTCQVSACKNPPEEREPRQPSTISTQRTRCTSGFMRCRKLTVRSNPCATFVVLSISFDCRCCSSSAAATCSPPQGCERCSRLCHLMDSTHSLPCLSCDGCADHLKNVLDKTSATRETMNGQKLKMESLRARTCRSESLSSDRNACGKLL